MTRKLPLALAFLGLTGCGHAIRPELAPNWAGFDFAKPPCPLSPRPDPSADEAAIRYLGAAGLYVEWQGSALLTGPFFTNPSLGAVLFRPLSSDAAAVQRGLAGMDLSRVRAIAVGHSHYDHLGDVPAVAATVAPRSRIWVNRTGAHALAPFAELRGRVSVLEDERGWIYLQDEQERPLPIRFRAVPTEHAPHFWGILLGSGEIRKDWTEPWRERHFLSLRVGKAFAFVIDLLSSDLRQVRFRMYYEDAANPEYRGFPTFAGADDHRYDLAVLCMASYQFVKRHPESILGRLRPRHVLVTHYEDFFRDARKPVRFVFPLTNGAANRFLVRTRDALAGQETAGPEGTVCGPSTASFTMPRRGEWMRFPVP